MNRPLAIALLLSCFQTVHAQEELCGHAARDARTIASRRTARVESVASSNYDVGYYRCTWNLTPSARTISGSVLMKFRALSTSSSIKLDMRTELLVDSIIFRGSNTTYVQGADNSLQINFPSPLAGGALDSVRIHYHGNPPATGYFVTTTHAGTPILYTQSESYGASHWWPCKDVLNDKADSIDIIVTCPSAYTSSSNGLVASDITQSGSRTTRWKHRYPIAPYLVAIAITNYSIATDAAVLPGRTLPMTMYSYPESGTAFQNSLTTAKYCIVQFSNLLSEYPFALERYGQTQWPLGGGMEHQTNSFIGSNGSSLSAHELGHQWFGDKVTCGSWSHIWLNEGFASYLEFQYMELTAPANRLAFLRSWTNTITANTSGSVYIPPADTLDENRIFSTRLTYDKGGYLAVMLRWKLGDSVFYRGLRRYLNDPQLAYGTALTADLQRNLEAESGQSLTEFFNDWFYGEGYPSYNAQWTPLANGSVQVTLGQTQSNSSVGFYEMPVPLQLKNATRDTTITVNHTSNNQVFLLQPGFVPDSVNIDPKLWILAKTRTSTKVTTAVSQLVAESDWSVFPNPARTSMTIQLPAGAWTGTWVRLINMAGQTVLTDKMTGPTKTLNVAGLAAGAYWLELYHVTKGVSRRKVVIGKE